MKLGATVALALLGASSLAAGSMAIGGDTESVVVFTNESPTERQRVSPQRSAFRRYDVREDAESGRLVRVASQPKRLLESAPATGTRKAPKDRVVQGFDAGPAKLRARVDIDALVQRASRRHGVDPEMIHAVIRQESNYNPFAVSSKGACGLVQLMPRTAERFGVKDIFDPAENVEGGVKYLRLLLDRYHGDRALSLAAYNAGEGAVDRYAGVPPFAETRQFVAAVQRWQRTDNDEADGEIISQGENRLRIVTRVAASGFVSFEME